MFARSAPSAVSSLPSSLRRRTRYWFEYASNDRSRENFWGSCVRLCPRSCASSPGDVNARSCGHTHIQMTRVCGPHPGAYFASAWSVYSPPISADIVSVQCFGTPERLKRHARYALVEREPTTTCGAEPRVERAPGCARYAVAPFEASSHRRARCVRESSPEVVKHIKWPSGSAFSNAIISREIRGRETIGAQLATLCARETLWTDMRLWVTL